CYLLLGKQRSSTLLQLDGLEVRRQDNFQDLAVVRVTRHRVLYARRLDPAASLFHYDRSLSLQVGLDPALQDVDHLEVDLVIVTLRDLLTAKRRQEPYDVCLHHAVRRLVEPQVTVLRVGSQTVCLEILIPMMADGELLCRPAPSRGVPGRGPFHLASQLCLRLAHAVLLRIDRR